MHAALALNGPGERGCARGARKRCALRTKTVRIAQVDRGFRAPSGGAGAPFKAENGGDIGAFPSRDKVEPGSYRNPVHNAWGELFRLS